MKKRFIYAFSIFTAVLLFSINILAKVDFPEPTSAFFVNDFANVISETDKQTILELGASLYKQTTAQVVVVTVENLQGESIEDYAADLGNTWGIGQADEDNGVLILLAIQEREYRIEVGYGLQGQITDSKAGRIREDYMAEHLKANDFSTGLLEGYKAIVATVYDEYNIEYEGDLPQETLNGYIVEDDNSLPIFGIVVLVIILIFIPLQIFGRRRYFGRSHRGYHDTWWWHGGGGFGGGSGFGGGGGFSGGGGGGFSGGGGSFGGGGSSGSF